MSLARTGIVARLIAVAALAALTAGCFHPMYAEHTDGTPGLREKLMGVEIPPVDKPNASREARVGVEIRNALAFKLYGNATGMAPTHRLVLRFTTARSSLIVDVNAEHRELRHRRAVQSGRDRLQQIGHDRYHVLARVL
jgi:LPS-assembly lipoprotein